MAKKAMLNLKLNALVRLLMLLLLLSTLLVINMEQVNFGYSLKNIPIPSKQDYLLELINSVGIFVANLRWRCHFYLNPSNQNRKESFDFKTSKAAPSVPELTEFEKAHADTDLDSY